MLLITLLNGSCTAFVVEDRPTTLLIPSHHILGEAGDPTIGLSKPHTDQPTGTPLTLYIGGDGNPQSLFDPSPQHAIALNLATKDLGAWVIGRPCYQLPTSNAKCVPELWQRGRYGESVLTAMSGIIEQLLDYTDNDAVRLVGYSGGGTLAVLLSDQLAMVSEVITLASPLDLAAWARLRGSSPPDASFDPTTHHRSGGASGTTRYLHLVAGRDAVVPMQHAAAYAVRFPEEQFRTFPLYDHACCWVRDWHDILQESAGH